MSEKLKVWVILRSLLLPRTGAAAVAFPGTLVLQWVGVPSQPGTIHPLRFVFFRKEKAERMSRITSWRWP